MRLMMLTLLLLLMTAGGAFAVTCSPGTCTPTLDQPLCFTYDTDYSPLVMVWLNTQSVPYTDIARETFYGSGMYVPIGMVDPGVTTFADPDAIQPGMIYCYKISGFNPDTGAHPYVMGCGVRGGSSGGGGLPTIQSGASF